MERKGTLEKINSEDHVNEIISRDEESPLKESSGAVKMAEDLIRQLPDAHDGRNQWLRKYGESDEAKKLRQQG